MVSDSANSYYKFYTVLLFGRIVKGVSDNQNSLLQLKYTIPVGIAFSPMHTAGTLNYLTRETEREQ